MSSNQDDNQFQAPLLKWPKSESDYDKVLCSRGVWRIIAAAEFLVIVVCVYVITNVVK